MFVSGSSHGAAVITVEDADVVVGVDGHLHATLSVDGLEHATSLLIEFPKACYCKATLTATDTMGLLCLERLVLDTDNEGGGLVLTGSERFSALTSIEVIGSGYLGLADGVKLPRTLQHVDLYWADWVEGDALDDCACLKTLIWPSAEHHGDFGDATRLWRHWANTLETLVTDVSGLMHVLPDARIDYDGPPRLRLYIGMSVDDCVDEAECIARLAVLGGLVSDVVVVVEEELRASFFDESGTYERNRCETEHGMMAALQDACPCAAIRFDLKRDVRDAFLHSL